VIGVVMIVTKPAGAVSVRPTADRSSAGAAVFLRF